MEKHGLVLLLITVDTVPFAVSVSCFLCCSVKSSRPVLPFVSLPGNWGIGPVYCEFLLASLYRESIHVWGGRVGQITYWRWSALPCLITLWQQHFENMYKYWECEHTVPSDAFQRLIKREAQNTCLSVPHKPFPPSAHCVPQLISVTSFPPGLPWLWDFHAHCSLFSCWWLCEWCWGSPKLSKGRPPSMEAWSCRELGPAASEQVWKKLLLTVEKGFGLECLSIHNINVCLFTSVSAALATYQEANSPDPFFFFSHFSIVFAMDVCGC